MEIEIFRPGTTRFRYFSSRVIKLLGVILGFSLLLYHRANGDGSQMDQYMSGLCYTVLSYILRDMFYNDAREQKR